MTEHDSTPENASPMDEATRAEFIRRRNRRSIAIALVLVALIVLFYGITLAIGPAVLKPSV